MTVPMMNTYCRRCHAAIISTAHSCPLCGLSKPNYQKLSELEKLYLDNPPTIPDRFEESVKAINPTQPLIFQLFKVFASYLRSERSANMKSSILIGIVAVVIYVIFLKTYFIGYKSISLLLGFAALGYILYDLICLIKASYATLLMERLNLQGGTSPYSVHFKIESVLHHELKNLQSLLNAFYERPWEELKKEVDIKLAGDSFVQATKAITAKIIKFAKISQETFTLIWRNNVYAITSDPNSDYEQKINNLRLKIRESEAFILRYCWFNQFSMTHEFIEAHLNGSNNRTTDEDKKYVIDGMQLNPMGPLSEPYYGNIDGAPFELQFIMRYFWHQQLRPESLPADEIIAQFPETAEIFESISQLKSLIAKLEEQKLINSATAAISGYSADENAITVEARQIKNFELYSEYLDIPKFQTSDEELHKRIDHLNAQTRV